jgi:hypothetical protein
VSQTRRSSRDRDAEMPDQQINYVCKNCLTLDYPVVGGALPSPFAG